MIAECLYLCNAARLVVKNKQTLEKYGCVLYFGGESSSGLVFICQSYLVFCWSFFGDRFSFEELRKCLIETYLRKNEGIDFLVEFVQLTSSVIGVGI